MSNAPKKPSKKSKKPSKKDAASPSRRLARRLFTGGIAALALLNLAGVWYAGHDPAWLEECEASLPRFVTRTLLYFGDRARMLTDALDLTGHDAVYDSDDPPPTGQVFFAGAPVRRALPAPADIRMLDRGPFVIGWSDALKHPVWVGYHVPREARFEAGKRPSFRKDRALADSPAAAAYERTGYDRGHMAPNRAIATRFGPDAQARTFLMSNIAPQTPSLNRGPWRELEQRIADLWTQRWGEIWVLCGAVSGKNPQSRQTLGAGASHIDVPESYWMLLVAQSDEGVRALSLVLPQSAPYDDFPVHRIVSIEELERITGLDLLPNLPTYLQHPLEADRPTRLWPIRLQDVFKLILLRFN